MEMWVHAYRDAPAQFLFLFKHQVGSDGKGGGEKLGKVSCHGKGISKCKGSADKGGEDRRGSIGSGYQGKGGENGRVSFS